ncbi:ribosome silencing factor [Agrobacterium vitis]|uniref:ribosome silencing factor n=1 Tax=Rhizobium/Agrobacterium group TaxID=227290 RepID=UPI0012E8A8A1|nr:MULTISPECIES: ribosome silencing factor [Rhizobium/Agrobacterium group]MCF1473998.1 ribosome silencing factor [Allorhizobium ampelinum]MVA49915.1 ribosome silencing factor [Agrobacterium vitis]NSZ51183.1 ribosome silencing factor [Agrobacterium vitis]NTA33184.1 ribosome silencing factor [Agrobacterium vitis]BCH64350.1 ribosomal silencing factor RsfS [Agrobacterium vitis]
MGASESFSCCYRRKGQTLTTVHTKGRATVAIPQSPERGVDAAARALELVLTSLEDSKAEDIVSIDIAGKSALGDYMVVVSGRSSRHVVAICEHLVSDLKDEGFGAPRVEGLETGDWVLIDAGDIIIHVFRPEIREFYNIEKMWAAPDIEEGRLH